MICQAKHARESSRIVLHDHAQSKYGACNNQLTRWHKACISIRSGGRIYLQCTADIALYEVTGGDFQSKDPRPAQHPTSFPTPKP